MYDLVILLHSWLRWLVILGGLGTLGLAGSAWLGGRTPGKPDRIVSAAFMGLFDLQILLGLLLYGVLSPFVKGAMADMGASMGNSAVRFFLVEHLFGMVVAVIVAHVGRVMAKKRPDEKARARTLFISTLVALLIVLASIPWPGLPYERPLFRP